MPFSKQQQNAVQPHVPQKIVCNDWSNPKINLFFVPFAYLMVRYLKYISNFTKESCNLEVFIRK